MPDDAMKPSAQTKGMSISYYLSPEERRLHDTIGRTLQKAARLLEENKVSASESVLREAIELSAGMRGGRWEPRRDPSGLMGDVQARIFFRRNQYERAAALYGFRSNGGLNLNAALAFVKTGRYAEAEKAWNTNFFLLYHDFVKPYLPGERTARDWEFTLFLARGMVDFDERRYGSAAWALERAARLFPHNPVALWYYGKALARNNRRAEAHLFYKAAIRYDHSGPIARTARHDLHLLDPLDPNGYLPKTR